jgi:Winged helix DNA-binding domain
VKNADRPGIMDTVAQAEKVRAWWSHRQGLDGALDGAAAADVFAKTGWARSVGGVCPYLTLFSRAGIPRESADAAAANLEIHELPAVRGCTYVLPASDFALGLKAGESFADAEMNVARKLGVADQEIEKLCDAVVKALAKGPLDPEGIREATGPASRNLGEAGKKKGLSTTLPVALGKLQALGEIRRLPANGRLDQQRYSYQLWRPNPRAKYNRTPEEVNIELARRYFHWAGPATIAQFQWFSALSVKASKAAMEPLKLSPFGEGRFMLPEDRAELESFKVPKQPQYALVSSIDGISLLRRDLAGITEPADLKKVEKLGGIADLPSHAILDRGRLVGLWEYDTATESIAWLPFIGKNKDLEKAVKTTEQYIQKHLGDARSFSLDSPKRRAPRIAALRKAAM